MRIVAWNRAGGLHRKLGPLLKLKPDIAVVSECAEPEVLERKGGLPAFSAPPVWTGDDLNRGLAVFFFNGAAGRLHGRFDTGLRRAVPVEILGGLGPVSAYRAKTGEAQGKERVPTLYWRDRGKGGPPTASTTSSCPAPGRRKVSTCASAPSTSGSPADRTARASATTRRWSSPPGP